jgi:hypothetical protein
MPATPALSVRAERRFPITASGVAGIGYLAVWLVGLVIWPSNLSVTSTGTQVVHAFAGHTGQAIAQYVLTQGLAGCALAVVVIAFGPALSGGLGLAARIAGYGAVTVSLVQCALGVHLAGWVAPDGDTDSARTLFDLLNRLDGVKMSLLAVMAAAASVAALRARALSRWLGHTGNVLAIALIASGIGYLLADTALAQAAWVSLPLLLVWVTGTGLTLRSFSVSATGLPTTVKPQREEAGR